MTLFGCDIAVADEKAWNRNVAMLQSEQGEIRKDGRALATDERQAMLLQKASEMHSAAADSLEVSVAILDDCPSCDPR